MRAANPAINAIVVDLSAPALVAARADDRALAKGAAPGKLHGVRRTLMAIWARTTSISAS
jgi:hypothetical protein